MPDMLTAKDLQDLLHIDRSTVYRMAEDGRLPALKVGRQWRFYPGQIDTWLGQQGQALDRLAPAVADLTQELPLACVQLIQDTFAELLGVMLLVTDMQGNPVTQISHPCGLYEALLPNSLEKCREQWRALADAIELKPRFEVSHLGLLCIWGLIRDGAQLKGVLVMGGIAPSVWPPTPAQIERISAELGVSPQCFAPHSAEVYRLNDAQKLQAQTYVQRIADIFSHILRERKLALQGA